METKETLQPTISITRVKFTSMYKGDDGDENDDDGEADDDDDGDENDDDGDDDDDDETDHKKFPLRVCGCPVEKTSHHVNHIPEVKVCLSSSS